MAYEGSGQDWEGRVHRTPSAAEIRTLVDTHGWEAVEERFWWLSRRTMSDMIKPPARQPEA